jgi:hypothetical protein
VVFAVKKKSGFLPGLNAFFRREMIFLQISGNSPHFPKTKIPMGIRFFSGQVQIKLTFPLVGIYYSRERSLAAFSRLLHWGGRKAGYQP